MRIALKSALMLVTRVINAINPRLDLHLQRTALISYKLSLALDLPASQQKPSFWLRCYMISACLAISGALIR